MPVRSGVPAKLKQYFLSTWFFVFFRATANAFDDLRRGFRPKDRSRKSYFIPLREDKASATWPTIASDEDQERLAEYSLGKVAGFSDAIEKAEYSADAFLLTANAGSIVTILGFLQKGQELRDSSGIKLALLFFFLSVIFLTFVKLFRILRLYFQRGEWTKNCSVFFSGDIGLEELLKRDAEAWRYPKLMIYTASLSYMSFLAGAVFAAFSLAGLGPGSARQLPMSGTGYIRYYQNEVFYQTGDVAWPVDFNLSGKILTGAPRWVY